MSATRHFARTKPIIVVKAGKYGESAQAAASHTGSLTGEDMIYEAAFQRAGIVRVKEIEDLFNCSEVLGMQPLPKGPNMELLEQFHQGNDYELHKSQHLYQQT